MVKYNKFKENLASYRKLFKMTQKVLATKLGTSINNIGHWEKGRTEPSIEMLFKICEVFNISIDELLR